MMDTKVHTLKERNVNAFSTFSHPFFMKKLLKNIEMRINTVHIISCITTARYNSTTFHKNRRQHNEVPLTTRNFDKNIIFELQGHKEYILRPQKLFQGCKSYLYDDFWTTYKAMDNLTSHFFQSLVKRYHHSYVKFAIWTQVNKANMTC